MLDDRVALVGATLIEGERSESREDSATPESAEPSDRTVWVSDVASPTTLAARAVAAALAAAAVQPLEVSRLWYAWTHHQGHHFWSPAHAVADLAGCCEAVPLGVQQMCNGAAAALQVCHDTRGRVPGPR